MIILNNGTNDINCVYHISNINIRDNSNLCEFEQICMKLYKNLKENLNSLSSIMVICGGVFLTNVYTEKSVNLCKNFIINILKIMPLIIVYTPNDNIIRSLFDFRDNIYFIPQHSTEEYIYNNIKFGGLYTNVTNIPNLKNICIDYITYDDYCINKKVINNKDYELVLLGGCERFMFLDDLNTAGYCGSLIQRNFICNYREHGYIIWSLNKDSTRFVNIKNDFAHIILTFKNGAANLPKYSELPERPNILVKYEGLKHECEKYIKTVFPYANKTLFMKINNEKLEHFNLDKRKMIYDYIKDQTIKDSVIKYYDDVIAKIKYQDEKQVELEIIDLSFENMFSYGQRNFISFKKPGIYGLNGKNGGGKSNIFHIIMYLLYGKFTNANNQSALNNKKTYFIGILNILLNKEHYRIVKYQTIKSPVYTRVYKFVNGARIPLFYNTPDSDKFLSDIGTFSTFINSCMVNYKDLNYLDLSEVEKISLLNKLYGMLTFEKVFEFVKHNITDDRSLSRVLTPSQPIIIDDVKKLNLEKQELEKKIKINNKKIVSFTSGKESKDKDINSIVKHSAELYNKISIIDSNIATSAMISKKMEADQIEIEKVKNIINIKETLLEATSKKGLGITLLASIFKKIEVYANEFLSSVSNLQMRFVENSPLIEVIDKDNNDNTVKSGCNSGYQNSILSLAIRYAFLQTCMKRTTFIFIDEGFSSFDADNSNQISLILNLLREKFKTIILISHQDIVKNEYDYEINIVKNNDSRVGLADVACFQAEIEALNIPKKKKDIALDEYKNSNKIFIDTSNV